MLANLFFNSLNIILFNAGFSMIFKVESINAAFSTCHVNSACFQINNQSALWFMEYAVTVSIKYWISVALHLLIHMDAL